MLWSWSLSSTFLFVMMSVMHHAFSRISMITTAFPLSRSQRLNRYSMTRVQKYASHSYSSSSIVLHEGKLDEQNEMEALSIDCLEEEIYKLANKKINVNSSRQVASCVFQDSKHSANRKALSDFILSRVNDFQFWTNETLSDERRRVQLAEKVLVWRDLNSKLKKMECVNNVQRKSDQNSTARRPFTTSSRDDMKLENKDSADKSSGEMNTSKKYSKQKHPLDFLFSESSMIDNYWFESLDRLEKPSSKALLSQLNPQCVSYN